MQTHAQIIQIPISDGITMDRFYSGIFTKTHVSTDSLYTFNQTTFRAGALFKYQIDPKFRINTFGVIRLSSTPTSAPGTIGSSSGFELVYTPSSSFSIAIGPGTPLAAEMRPNPTTPESQVETNAQLQGVAGGRLMFKAKYSLRSDIIIAYGLSYFNKVVAKQATLVYRAFRLSYYNEEWSHLLATDAKTKYIDYTIMYTHQKNISTSVFLKLNSRWSPYVDYGLDLKSNNTSFFESGLRLSFLNNNVYTKGYIGVAYNSTLMTVSGQLFLHLTGKYECRN